MEFPGSVELKGRFDQYHETCENAHKTRLIHSKCGSPIYSVELFSNASTGSQGSSYYCIICKPKTPFEKYYYVSKKEVLLPLKAIGPLEALILNFVGNPWYSDKKSPKRMN